MRFWLAAFAALTAFRLVAAEPSRKHAPAINAGGVVNAASFAPAPENFVAPNSIVAIFGIDLALRTRAVGPGDLEGNELPLSLGGVVVRIGNQRAPLFFVSPTQINAQIPTNLVPREQPWPLSIVREGLNSETDAEVHVRQAAPGLFPVVTHVDGTLVGRGEPEGATPAEPGETIILYGTGFGPTAPFVREGELPSFAARLVFPSSVWIADRHLTPEALLYIGQTPFFAGLQQANVVLPEDLEPGDPEIFVEVASVLSQAGVRVEVERLE